MITFTDLVISILIAYLIYLIFDKNKEDFTDNREAKSNINTIYNTDNLIVNNLVVDGAFNMIPRGCVVAWNNPNIPKGWALCNGQNGTPDLRGRFILGIGHGDGLTNRNLGDKGGEVEHILNVNELPLHNHAYVSGLNTSTAMSDISGGGKDYDTANSNLDENRRTGETGGDQPHNNMHPYYKLAFVMKLPN